ncbi:energy transducer TonB [Synoicihabitans lomoniglobus]|uniref:Energy transducer TonB n=1 Tax=Synoicihabitans lomoniglobus TaxID=2909285 RepID=A0AAF0CIE0_9BACT|nr:energy transducer TonB [Opitutaceae bacterium LMO-M01]WED65282.1 energy transducer TonB [Opitutaceae bacterium LMO-M01]
MKTKLVISCAIAIALSGSSLVAADQATARSPEARDGGVSKVAHIKGMDQAPVIETRVAPVYPRELREKGIQGLVTVEMLIDSTGRVVEANAVRATAPAFANQAVEAARQWTFKPAEAKGQKISTRVLVPFEFVMPQIAAWEADSR